MRAVYLDGPAPTFGLLHAAAGGAASTAVVLVPPFGWDEVASYRPRRAWAEHLAAEGRPALRIDLPGTGDSAGGPADPDRLAAWTRAVADAAAWLRGETGAERVAAVGLGLGGLVARLALGEDAPIDDLVLWGTPSRGRALVRELRAFARLESAATGVPPRPVPDGGLEVGGYLLTRETGQALEAVDLATLPPEQLSGVRVLALGRDGMAPEARLVEHLEASPAAVATGEGAGYGAMMGEPRLVVAPRTTFAQVSSWLDAPAGAPARAPRPTPAARDALTLRGAGGRACVESALEIDHDGVRLFGVLAEPVGPRADVCVVWLNAGPVRRTGPNRMWVEAARRWALRGVPVARVDLEAIGDADGEREWGADESGFYADDYVDQAVAVLAALAARGVAQRFVVGGLCSGAYWALHAALRDERVAGVMLLNPRALVWDAWHHNTKTAGTLRKLVSRDAWRRLAAGRLSFQHLGAALRAAAVLALRTPARLLTRRARAGGDDAVDSVLDELLEASRRVLLLFTDDEPLRTAMEATGQLARARRRPGLHVELLDDTGAVHVMRPLWVQARVHAAVDAWLDAELARARLDLGAAAS